MTAIWPFIRRLINIVFAYLLASCSSGLVVATLLHLLPQPPGSRGVASDPFLSLLSMTSFMITLFAAPPAVITILFGEWKSIRRKRYYAIAGTLIGLALSLMFYLMNWFPYVGAGYGAAAGLIYWFFAGRRAGLLAGTRSQIALLVVLGVLFAGMALYFGLPMLGVRY